MSDRLNTFRDTTAGATSRINYWCNVVIIITLGLLALDTQLFGGWSFWISVVEVAGGFVIGVIATIPGAPNG